MKFNKFILGLFLFVSFTSSVVTANEISYEQTSSTYSVGINPLGLFFGYYSVDVGYIINKNTITGIDGTYLDSSLFGLNDIGMGMGAYASYHFSGVGESGLYSRGSFRYLNSKKSVDTADFELRSKNNVILDNAVDRSVTISALAGYQWFFTTDMSVDFGVGYQAKIYGDGDFADGAKLVNIDDNKEFEWTKSSGVDGRLGLNILF
ncbi:MAG: hypothetical protein AB8G05_22585 [Oligoflexales bacterium]